MGKAKESVKYPAFYLRTHGILIVCDRDGNTIFTRYASSSLDALYIVCCSYDMEECMRNHTYYRMGIENANSVVSWFSETPPMFWKGDLLV